MTVYDVQIDDLVLRGVPASYSVGFAGLVEVRLTALARGETIGHTPGQEDGDAAGRIADQVAEQIWSQIHGSAGGGDRT